MGFLSIVGGREDIGKGGHIASITNRLEMKMKRIIYL